MAEKAKEKTVAQPLSGCRKVAANSEPTDRKWLLDALEDDEVRENLEILHGRSHKLSKDGLATTRQGYRRQR